MQSVSLREVAARDRGSPSVTGSLAVLTKVWGIITKGLEIKRIKMEGTNLKLERDLPCNCQYCTLK